MTREARLSMKKTIPLILLGALLLMPGARAAGELKKYYSDDNRVIREDYVLEDGALVVGEGGFARHELEYDAQGRAVHELYLDAALLPVGNRDGIVEIERVYDDDGRLAAIHYRNGAGAPALNESLGAYGEAWEYDAAGNVISDTLLDAEGRSMVGAGGWARAEYGYDEAGRKTRERYTDAAGAPMMTGQGYAIVRRTLYTEESPYKGKVESEFYFDEQGNPIRKDTYV